MMDDSKRNEIVVSVASKIKQDGVSYDEQDPSIMEQYVKHALSLGAGAVSYTHLRAHET